MSGIRLLVGTRKGAFIFTADGKRANWEISGPHFAGWEIYHLKGSPVNPDRILRLAIDQLVWATDSALRGWRQDLGADGERLRL